MTHSSHKINKYLLRCQRILTRTMVGKTLIQFNRFATFGRNAYGNKLFNSVKPTVAFSDVDWWGTSNSAVVFSEEKKSGVRIKDTQCSRTNVFEVIKSNIYKNKSIPILSVWQNTDEYEKLAKVLNAIILAMPAKVGLYLEDKTNFNNILKNSGVHHQFLLKELIFTCGESIPNYKTLCSYFGRKFVMQGRGMGGRGTKIIKSLKDLVKAKQNLKGKIRITEYYKGFSSNVNILSIPDKKRGCLVYVGLPSFKATAIPEIGVPEATSAGSDWSLKFPLSLTSEFVKYVERIGHYIYKKFGLIGVWGLDSIWKKNNFRFNELNCRVQGTTDVGSINELLRGVPPFLLSHYLIFLDQEVSWMPAVEEFNKSTAKMMSKIATKRPFYLKIKVKGGRKLCLQSSLKSGIYKIKNSHLQWLQNRELTSDADFDKNEILIANLPKKETICYPGSQLCTLEGITQSRHIFSSPHTLSSQGKRISQIIYKYFKEIK